MYNSMKQTVKRVLEARPYIDSVEFISMTAEEIRQEIDYTYEGGDRGEHNDEILKVYYADDLCACPTYVLHWAWIKPSALADKLEI